jgi:serine/threonine-protein kinase
VATNRPIRAPLEEALASELRRIDRRLAIAWAMLSLGGFLLGIYAAIVVRPGFGIAIAAVCLVATIPFALAAWVLGKRPLPRAAELGILAFVSVAPWVFFVVILLSEGPVFALGSWVPPMIYTALMVASVARLRPLSSIVVGAIGAVSHLVVYFVLAAPRLVAADAIVFVRPSMQITRAISLLVGGMVGAFVAWELRRAIGRAESKVHVAELFGKYRLVRPIGTGGAGVVHEAIYSPAGGFERRVAVKVLHPALATEPAFVDGLRHEAELGSRLAHPNVVTIHDFGMHEGVAFMAMEYVDGMSLERLATRARRAGVAIPAHVVGYVGQQVLTGLAYAHEAVHGEDGEPLRILHRDVCPQNLMVSSLGEVKLTDFGIARVLGRAAATTTHTIAGHEAYMAPEQARGEEITLRADLFAVGIVLWELLAGRHLFVRENGAATLLAMLEEPVVPINAIRGELDDAWNAFFARAIAREPAARFGSAAEMAAALGGLPGARADKDESQAALRKLVAALATAAPSPEPDGPTRR